MRSISRVFLLATVLLTLTSVGSPSAVESDKLVLVASVNDQIINPVIDEYLREAIEEAEARDAECLIIRLDTPGGLLTATRSIVRDILNSKVPVVVYIAPSGARAGSAGVFITLASHVAAMSPSTNIGAAHPVQMGGKEKRTDWQKVIRELASRKKKEDAEDEKSKSNFQPRETDSKDSENPMNDKILNDTVAWVKAIAQHRNRNAKWATLTVSESRSSTETEALKQKAVELIAVDTQDLLQQLNGRWVETDAGKKILNTQNAQVEALNLSARQEFLLSLSHPNIAYILMMLGFYGLLFEFTHPGFGFPGVAGLICLILAFFSFQALPINYAGMALIVAGIAFLIAEAFVPAFGLFALGGIAAMFLGSVLLFNSSQEFLSVSLQLIVPIVLAAAGIAVFLMRMALKAYRQKPSTGSEGLVGATGIAETALKPTGKIKVQGQIWNALSQTPVSKGQRVEVVEVKGLTLIVKKATKRS